MTKKLLFVCSGNICRSPMALGIARAYAIKHGIAAEVDSAGTLMIEGREADPKAVAACRDIGIDLSTHRSKGIQQEHVEWADYVLTMEAHHGAFVSTHFPESRHKVVCLAHLIGEVGVPDPIGRNPRFFKKNRTMVERAVEAFLQRLPR